ncbi:unnamed protein product [Cuscuta epithymum]|uniref:SOSEKI DIX-like domain-containing protein n=1 Tax=Cuscuta epithymum TaxID=186058 RepID=A0AAV0GIU9_9ASTE|nr:unnamed protein product [Cuscuta epithymum]
MEEVHRSAAAAAEVRKLHIIYFISRKGRTEHPHLFRVHHLSRHGVHLRDVKRWLGELRGKELPSSFAWSYKRKYKTGYVWQDVVDDDLLTPISDNEYVLKGSEITSSTPTKEKGAPMQKELEFEGHNRDDSKLQLTKEEINQWRCHCHCYHHQAPIDKTTSGKKTASEEIINTEEEEDDDESSPILLRREASTMTSEESDDARPPSTPLRSQFSKNKISEDRKKRAVPQQSGIFRSIITCGNVDTKDSAVVRRQPYFGAPPSSDLKGKTTISTEICYKPAKLDGGSQRTCTARHSQPRKTIEGLHSNGRRPFSGAYRAPKCSQCGKPFNPEKLYSHMKSCKRMKNCGKSAHQDSSAAENSSKRSSTQQSMNNKSVSSYCSTF